MFIFIVVIAGIVLFTALTVAILPLSEIYHSNNSQIIAGEIASIQRAVSVEAADDLGDFYANGYSYPSAVSGARINVNTPQYRDLFFLNTERYRHIKTNFEYFNSSSESVYSHRFAMWFESPFGNFLGDDYTKADSNKCGTGDVLTAQAWCGNTKSLWAKLESHTGHYGLIQSEQHRLYRLSRLFYRYYEETGTFDGLVTNKDALANIVDGGMPVSVGSCAGVYYLKGIPLGCQEMFNSWGEPIYLHFEGNNHIALTNSLGIKIVQPLGAVEKHVGLAEIINLDEVSLALP